MPTNVFPPIDGTMNSGWRNSYWIIQTPDLTSTVQLPYNPAFDSDSDTNFEAGINIGTNLGASVSYFQYLNQPSPKRELGMSGEKLYVDRATRNGLVQLYRAQNTVYGFLYITPRTPFSGNDDTARVVMHPLKLTRCMINFGDFYELQATFTYLDIQSYQ